MPNEIYSYTECPKGHKFLKPGDDLAFGDMRYSFSDCIYTPIPKEMIRRKVGTEEIKNFIRKNEKKTKSKFHLINMPTLVDLNVKDTRYDPKSPLILIKKSGEIRYAKNRGEKDDLVTKYSPGDVLLYAWSGQWSTDVFTIPENKVVEYFL
jgi:hypothetical protein